jgi:hypothetical protein
MSLPPEQVRIVTTNAVVTFQSGILIRSSLKRKTEPGATEYWHTRDQQTNSAQQSKRSDSNRPPVITNFIRAQKIRWTG